MRLMNLKSGTDVDRFALAKEIRSGDYQARGLTFGI